ncbi:MAG: hypothetical protein MHM6MM_009053, partial [Cercozoa sp. M6MM]
MWHVYRRARSSLMSGRFHVHTTVAHVSNKKRLPLRRLFSVKRSTRNTFIVWSASLTCACGVGLGVKFGVNHFFPDGWRHWGETASLLGVACVLGVVQYMYPVRWSKGRYTPTLSFHKVLMLVLLALPAVLVAEGGRSLLRMRDMV